MHKLIFIYWKNFQYINNIDVIFSDIYVSNNNIVIDIDFFTLYT